MNYLKYFNILKFLKSGKLPSSGDFIKDLKLLHIQDLYSNEGLSTEGTPEEFILDLALLKGPFDGILNLVGKVAKGIKSTLKTNKFLKFVGKTNSKKGIDFSKLSETEKDFVVDLLKLGINTSKLSESDIKTALTNRKTYLQNTAPNKRYALVTEEPMENSLIRGKNTMIEAFSPNSSRSTGYLRLETNPNEYSVGMIQSNNIEKGISQLMYNAAIGYAKQNGLSGIVSGKLLFEPKITSKVWKHYPKKQLIGDYGHQIGVGSKTPVYLLTEQSYAVPLKNATKFNINILDKQGNMLVDWSNPNMFYENGGKI